MSGVTFNSLSDDSVRLRGAERHWAGALVDRIGIGILDPGNSFNYPKIMAALKTKPSYGLRRGSDDLAMYLRSSIDTPELVLKDGRTVNVWSMLLNTTLRVGNRAMKFLARMHAQCEIHAWVDGPNRNWLADIIEEGLTGGVMRTEMGWEDVVKLLRLRSDEPIVMSYSVTENFPNRTIAKYTPPVGEDGEPDEDAYYDLDPEVQWSAAMAGLKEIDGGLEIKPDDFDDYFFREDVSALNLYQLLPQDEATNA